MASNNNGTTFNGGSIRTGDFLQIEFGTDFLMWVMVNKMKGPGSVHATILEQGRGRYPQGRSMDIYLKYARGHRSKDNPPPLWSTAQGA